MARGKKAKKKGRKRGRPRLELSPTEVEKHAAIGCTLEEMAWLFGCSLSLLEKRVAKEDPFVRALESGRAQIRISLRRVQIKQAKAGDRTMLVWLGKQMLGQREPRHELSGPNGGAIPFTGTVLTPEQLRGLTEEELETLESVVAKLAPPPEP